MDTQLTHQPNMDAILSVENLISHPVSSSEEEILEDWAMFDVMKEQDPNSFALFLAQIVGPSDSHDVEFRESSAFLLRKLLTDDKCYIWNNNLSVATQSTVKSVLLVIINLEEYSVPITETLCKIVSELCNISNNWPEPLLFLKECVTSNANRVKVSFFHIFSNLAQDICKKLFPDIMALQPFFLKAMNDDTLNFYTRCAALSASINFIQCLSSLNALNQVQSLYPAMMRTLADTLTKGDGDVASQCTLGLYIKLAKSEPRFFRTYIVDLVNTMFEIAENMNLEEKTRHLALEFLLTLVEAREKAAGMMKKLPRFTHTYFALLLNLLLDVKDEPSWHGAENPLDWTWGTDNCIIGWSYLRRFSNALGGNTVFPIAIEQLDNYLAAPEWEKRHAALIALVYTSEGCSKVMKKNLERVVSMVLPYFQDPYPQVRWAAITSIAQFSIDYSLDLQEEHHNQIVPALAAAMDDQHPRVQGMAAVAVKSYFNRSKMQESLLPYVDVIFNKLLVLLQNDNQEVALDALANVADASKEYFQQYYDFIMPRLKTILVNAKDKSNDMLHCKALGCISMIGMAVGIEKFRDDVKQVVEVLISSQESPTKEFRTIYHILQAWVRIGCCMGKDVLPYMSTIMPLLVKCAQLQPDNIIDEFSGSIHKIMFGEEMIKAKRSDILEVKSLACVLFGSYAKILEEDFYPWISQATSTLTPLLKFYVHNDVREKSSYALYRMLNSAKLAVEKGTAQGENNLYFKQLSCDIILALGDAFYTEIKVRSEMLLSLRDCLEICGPFLSEDLLRSTMDVIKYIIKASSCWRGELKEIEKSEDFDAEEAELQRDEIEEEEKVYELVGHILRILVETFKADFLPFFDELSTYIIPTKGKDKTTAEIITCMLMFNGIVRLCSEAALRYYNIYLPFLLDSINDENPYARECAIFGLGLCATHGFSVFKPFIGEALPRINEVIMHLNAREHENLRAFHVAVFALGEICKFHRETIDLEQIIPVWLSCLPVKGHLNLAKIVHDQLSLMVERSDLEFLGPKYEHFPKLLSVFIEILCAGDDLDTKETTNRLINVLMNLQKTIPPAIWASAVSLLLPQQQMELEYVLLPPQHEMNLESVLLQFQQGMELESTLLPPEQQIELESVLLQFQQEIEQESALLPPQQEMELKFVLLLPQQEMELESVLLLPQQEMELESVLLLPQQEMELESALLPQERALESALLPPQQHMALESALLLPQQEMGLKSALLPPQQEMELESALLVPQQEMEMESALLPLSTRDGTGTRSTTVTPQNLTF